MNVSTSDILYSVQPSTTELLSEPLPMSLCANKFPISFKLHLGVTV